MTRINVSVAALFLLVLVGCPSQQTGQTLTPEDRIAFASQQFTAVVHTANELIENGTIKDQKTKDVIFYAANEGHKALQDARANKGDINNLNYALRRVASAMDTLAKIWSPR